MYSVRKIICRNCHTEKENIEFVWMPSMENNRNTICRDCEAVEQHENGLRNIDIVGKICLGGEILKRADIYKYPFLLESYKFNYLIKKQISG